MKRTLILGYGNVDRQDDGVAWHVLRHLAGRLGWPVPETADDALEGEGEGAVALLFTLQLTPELAERLAGYERVCFIDAHTGRVPEALRREAVTPEFQASPFTHHMTPATCLAFCETLYAGQPEAILVSVRGYEFGFTHSLSEGSAALVEPAAGLVWEWMQEGAA